MDNNFINANAYYLNRNNEKGVAGYNGFAGLTESQMKQQDSFDRFNFNNTWQIDPTAAYPYPTLQNVSTLPTVETTEFGTSYETATQIDGSKIIRQTLDNPGTGHYYKLRSTEETDYSLRIDGEDINATVYVYMEGSYQEVTSTSGVRDKQISWRLQADTDYFIIVRHNDNFKIGSYTLELEKNRILSATINIYDDSAVLQISGHVNAQAQRDVLLRVLSPSNKIVIATLFTTDLGGEFYAIYSLPELEDGIYQVFLSAEGCDTVLRKTISIGTGMAGFEYAAILPARPVNLHTPSLENTINNDRLTANGTISYQGRLTNTDDKMEQNSVVILALYDSYERIYDYIGVSAALQPQEAFDFEMDMRLPSDITGYTMRILCLEGTDLYNGSMVPLTESVRISSYEASGNYTVDPALTSIELTAVSAANNSSALTRNTVDGVTYDYSLKAGGQYCERYLDPNVDMQVTEKITNTTSQTKSVNISNDFFIEGEGLVKHSAYKIEIPANKTEVRDTHIIAGECDSAFIYNRDDQGQDIIPCLELLSQRNDFYASTMDTASEVGVQTPITGRVNYENDVDYVKFQITDAGIYLISNDMDNKESLMYAYLYDNAGTLVEGRANGMTPGNSIVRYLEQGTYYLKLTAPWVGNYCFNVLKKSEAIKNGKFENPLQIGFNKMTYTLTKNERAVTNNYTLIVYMKWNNDQDAPAIGYEKQRIEFTIDKGVSKQFEQVDNVALYTRDPDDELQIKARLFDTSDLAENGEYAQVLVESSFGEGTVADMGGKAQPAEVVFDHRENADGKPHYYIFDDNPEHIRPGDLLDNTNENPRRALTHVKDLGPGVYTVFAFHHADHPSFNEDVYFDSIFYADEGSENWANVKINRLGYHTAGEQDDWYQPVYDSFTDYLNDYADAPDDQHNYHDEHYINDDPLWLSDIRGWNAPINYLDGDGTYNGGEAHLIMEFEVTGGHVNFCTVAYKSKQNANTEFGDYGANVESQFEDMNLVNGEPIAKGMGKAAPTIASTTLNYIIDETIEPVWKQIPGTTTNIDTGNELPFLIDNDLYRNHVARVLTTAGGLLNDNNRYGMPQSAIIPIEFDGYGVIRNNDGTRLATIGQRKWVFDGKHTRFVQESESEIPSVLRTYFGNKLRFSANEEILTQWLDKIMAADDWTQVKAMQYLGGAADAQGNPLAGVVLSPNPYEIQHEFTVNVYNAAPVNRTLCYMVENNFLRVRFQAFRKNSTGENVMLQNSEDYYRTTNGKPFVFEQELASGETTTIVIRITMIASANPGVHHAFMINPTDAQKNSTLLNNDLAKQYPLQ